MYSESHLNHLYLFAFILLSAITERNTWNKNWFWHNDTPIMSTWYGCNKQGTIILNYRVHLTRSSDDDRRFWSSTYRTLVFNRFDNFHALNDFTKNDVPIV